MLWNFGKIVENHNFTLGIILQNCFAPIYQIFWSGMSIASGGYSNSGAQSKDFQKLMFSKQEKEL